MDLYVCMDSLLLCDFESSFVTKQVHDGAKAGLSASLATVSEKVAKYFISWSIDKFPI